MNYSYLTKFMKCKPARIVFIFHDHTEGFCFNDEKRLKNSTFTFSMKNNTVEQLMVTIKHSLINYTHSQPCSIQVKEIEKRVRINLTKKYQKLRFNWQIDWISTQYLHKIKSLSIL